MNNETGLRPHVELEPGVTRLFGEYDLGTEGTGTGWAGPEEAHTWTNGPIATLHLLVKDCTGPVDLIFEGEAFVNSKCDHQDITLYVNGYWIGFWRAATSPAAAMVGRIEPEQFFWRNGMALLNCSWYLPNSARPSSLGFGDDDRELGLCFRSITVAEAPHVL